MNKVDGLIFALLFGCTPAFPQSPDLSFDVTSVKPRIMPAFGSGQRRMQFGCSPGGRFFSTGYLLIKSISWAWNVDEFHVSGLPAWTDARSRDAYYDIEATAGKPVTTDECKMMVRAMLADRFRLAAHQEKKLLSVDALVLAKGGAKLKKADPSRPGSGVVFNGHSVPARPEDGESTRGITMAQLAALLSYTTGKIDGRLVIDETGLEGRYEVHLDFDQFPTGLFGHDKPDVFNAVQQQLGLSLQERKRPFEVIVVDHMEKPTGN